MKGWLGTAAIVTLAIALAAGFSPAIGADQAATGGTTAAAQAVVAPAGEQSATPAAATAKKSVGSRVKRMLRRLNPMALVRARQYRRAASAFPGFCRHWGDLLHEREVYNLTRIKWVLKDGYQTGTYTGYSNIESCTCKQSPEGFAIGKLTYDEVEYYVAGKTTEQALQVKPRPISVTATTELFRWDRGKWFY